SRETWLGLREAPPPGLRFLGTFENTDLYRVIPLPEQGARIERAASYAFLLSHPRLRLVARPLTQSPKLEQWVEVALNGRPLTRVPLAEPVTVTARLTRRLSRVAPNVITVRHSYRPRPAALDAHYRIGTTGVQLAADLTIRSAGDRSGHVAAMRLNAVERTSD